MTALKAADVDAFVARPDAARPVVLIYGPDSGLVSERAQTIVRASVDNPDDPFSLVRIEGDDLSGNPLRLVEEANTIPLFGGRRAIWVKPTSRNIASAVESLIAATSPDCRVVIEAGDLKKSSPLRTLCERAKNAVALPCYADGERELARLVDDEMKQAGLTIAPDARAALRSVSRRRPRRLAQRDPQARALCAEERPGDARRRAGRGGGCLHARARQCGRRGLCRKDRRCRNAIFARRAPPAPRPARLRSRPCGRSRTCTGCGSPSTTAPRSAKPSPARGRRFTFAARPLSRPRLRTWTSERLAARDGAIVGRGVRNPQAAGARRSHRASRAHRDCRECAAAEFVDPSGSVARRFELSNSQASSSLACGIPRELSDFIFDFAPRRTSSSSQMRELRLHSQRGSRAPYGAPGSAVPLRRSTATGLATAGLALRRSTAAFMDGGTPLPRRRVRRCYRP